MPSLPVLDPGPSFSHIKVMQNRDIPGKTNLTITGVILALYLTSLLVMPYLMGQHPWLMTFITLLLIPLNTPLWSLIHEAIHKNFHSHKQVNEIAGRVMSVIFGASFGILRFGHLMHHQYNRDWESEYYTGSKIKAFAHHYFQMLGGLYLTEVLMSFMIAMLPAQASRKIARKIFGDDRHYEAVLNSVLKEQNVGRIRTDCLWIVLLYGCAFMSYGANAWVLALGLLGRAVIISIMDNSYHYGTPEDGSVVAKELETSAPYSRFILNFNYHMTHHQNVSLPWSQLKARHDEQATPYAEKIGSALLAQFKGPIPSDVSKR